MKLYDHPLSGNCYKSRLLLSHLGIEYEKVRVELFEGEHKSESFTKLNPNQKIPVLVDGEFTIWESNAVVLYIAKKFSPNKYFSDNPGEFGAIVQWSIFGKTSIDPYLAVSRYYLKFLGEGNYDKDSLKSLQEQGKHTLSIMDEHLSGNEFLSGNYSVADMCCYPYILLADEGGIDISEFSNVEKWCKRIESQPGYISIEA